MSTRTIACKRPKVTVEKSTTAVDLYSVECWVPGCIAHVYGPALKTDAEEQAARHRQAHRDAVPNAYVKADVEWDVYCWSCNGHLRTFGTRREADTWLAEHLIVEHGLVACP